MSERELDGLLASALDAVLETMFFSASMGPGEPLDLADPGLLAARLSFHGNPSGNLAVCISADAARPLAAGFLGADEPAVPDSQIGEVVCEMANMLCGSVVSSLESGQSFDLSAPELVSAETVLAEKTGPGIWTRQSVALETGTLTVTLELEEAA
jgi:CheY-specific phosphatase CheX